MNRKRCFIALLSIWFLLITSYVVYREYVINMGTEVLLKVFPVDPRDLFRGDYVILDYEISRMSANQRVFGNDGSYNDAVLYTGDTVYVMLVKDGRFYTGGDIFLSLPKEGLFIKGKVRYTGELNENAMIVYGIENFFVPENEGKDIESARNRGRVSAKIAVNAYGNAALKELYIDDKKVDFKNKNEKNN